MRWKQPWRNLLSNLLIPLIITQPLFYPVVIPPRVLHHTYSPGLMHAIRTSTQKTVTQNNKPFFLLYLFNGKCSIYFFIYVYLAFNIMLRGRYHQWSHLLTPKERKRTTVFIYCENVGLFSNMFKNVVSHISVHGRRSTTVLNL